MVIGPAVALAVPKRERPATNKATTECLTDAPRLRSVRGRRALELSKLAANLSEQKTAQTHVQARVAGADVSNSGAFRLHGPALRLRRTNADRALEGGVCGTIEPLAGGQQQWRRDAHPSATYHRESIESCLSTSVSENGGRNPRECGSFSEVHTSLLRCVDRHLLRELWGRGPEISACWFSVDSSRGPPRFVNAYLPRPYN